MSLDGAIGCADGTSQWITGSSARDDAHALRAKCQAIIVGSGTAIVDRPKLTVRPLPAGVFPPLRVVLDARGRMTEGPLYDTSEAQTIVFTTSAASKAFSSKLKEAGAEVIVVASGTGGIGVDLVAVLDELGRRGVLRVLVEGGAAVHSSFLQNGLANEVIFFNHFGAIVAVQLECQHALGHSVLLSQGRPKRGL